MDNELKVLHVERTENEIIGAMKDFAQTSCETVGINNTFDTLQFMTKIINESPDTYRKIFHPSTLAKINKLIESNKGGKTMGMMDIISTFQEVSSIFK
jgi:hypothetical protein